MAPTMQDRETLKQLLTDHAVRQYLGGALSELAAERRADAPVFAPAENRWSVRLRESERCIGLVELDRHHDGEDIEISYQFLPSSWGTGLATEAVSAVIGYCFDKLRLERLVAETQSANLPSRRLLERCGMREFKKVSRFGEDQIIYAVAKCS
ncbi:MAG: GNAT family N-acetyltransferase [Rhizobium sp.]|jgi:ribosomal-protein-alanine N-acetyltransferase